MFIRKFYLEIKKTCIHTCIIQYLVVARFARACKTGTLLNICNDPRMMSFTFALNLKPYSFNYLFPQCNLCSTYLVIATLIRRQSRRRWPTRSCPWSPPLALSVWDLADSNLTVDRMTTSMSRPWNLSTVLTSTPCNDVSISK